MLGIFHDRAHGKQREEDLDVWFKLATSVTSDASSFMALYLLDLPTDLSVYQPGKGHHMQQIHLQMEVSEVMGLPLVIIHYNHEIDGF